MQYKGDAPVETSGAKLKAGPYKFKVLEATEYTENQSVGLRCKLWEGEKEVTDKFRIFINFKSDAKDAIKQETARRVTVLMGKPEFSSEQDMVGKAGWVVLRQGPKYAELMPFGGMYDTKKKSANGNETMLERIEEAMAYDWRSDPYANKPEGQSTTPTSPEDGDTEPF